MTDRGGKACYGVIEDGDAPSGPAKTQRGPSEDKSEAAYSDGFNFRGS